MISFRYHVVSLVAVLLALAAGVVLGSGPLQREDKDPATGVTDAQALAEAQSQIDLLEQGQVFDDSYAAATAGDLVAGTLKGRAVTVVTLPGADEQSLARLNETIAEAGGTVSGQVDFGAALLDVANRTLVAELATQMQDAAKDKVEVPAGASGYERLGRLLAYAIGTTSKAGAPVDQAGDSILAGVSTADLVTTRGNISRRGSLIIVLAGDPIGSADQREGAASITATLADALDSGTDGVVVTGPLSAGAQDGLVNAVRTDPTAATHVSTVDVADRTAGAAIGVLALAQQADGETGHYGSSLAKDGPLPAR